MCKSSAPRHSRATRGKKKKVSQGYDEKAGKGRKKYQGDARHDKRCYEGSQCTSLRPALQAGPAEHVEITGSE